MTDFSNVTFASLGLAPQLLAALQDKGFVEPTPVQAESLPLMLEGRDIIAQAQTGTGKTAAFALPILQRIDLKAHAPQALILAPTRELAIQIAEQFAMLSTHLRGLKVAVLCGGQEYRSQLKTLKDGAQVVVGTPGRILDHISRSTLKLNDLRTFVLDEADEMLRMGFIEDVESILSQLPSEKQVALFSATMPHRIRQIAQNYLRDPASVVIQAKTATVQSITQKFLFASANQKPAALLRVLAVEDVQGVIIFTRTKAGSEEVATLLQQQGYHAIAIHGDLSQPMREKIIHQFRQGSLDILVATDVAARGLDVERVSHVINYDITQDCETYVHRIGRTGRAGRSGVSILFVSPRDSRMLSNIERHTRQSIEKMQVPSDKHIVEVKQQRFKAALLERISKSETQAYMFMMQQMKAENPDIDLAELAAAAALMANQDKSWEWSLPSNMAFQQNESRQAGRGREERKSPGRGFSDREERVHSRLRERESFSQMQGKTCYRISVGRVHGVKPGNIVGAIANEGGIASRQITGLKINQDHSIVYLPENLSKQVVNTLRKAWVCGQQLQLVETA